MQIVGVPAEAMWDIWPHIEGYFKSFEERSGGELTAGELVELVQSKHRQCWVATDGQRAYACALTRVESNPKGTVCLDFCAGNGREDWRDMMVAEIEKWAAHMGSERVRIICRPGWTKELKKLGYRETHRVLEREMKNG